MKKESSKLIIADLLSMNLWVFSGLYVKNNEIHTTNRLIKTIEKRVDLKMDLNRVISLAERVMSILLQPVKNKGGK